LGNALRRVLLSSLPGAAVEAFKIKGTPHEFTAIDGVKEDVIQIILNLKQLAIKVFTDEQLTLKIVKKGKGVVMAKDIEANANMEVFNKNLVIATLTSDREFEMEIIVGRGRGFKPAEEKDKGDFALGTVVIDSIYNPVKDIGYSVEYIRVGDITNYERLLVRVETNGTITSLDAAREAVKILMDHLNIILSNAINSETVAAALEDKTEVESKQTKSENSDSDDEKTIDKKSKTKKSKTKK
jgi:DNA-directed RNA polymerase subunit alpha